ncbi:fatty acid desaturase [Massilia glaciei]|uniref:Fatty acid desaturase n=1 Tax=Massilia glaciei TaxID=1524097 RepID=A0A2U2HK33_9BURK|nr:fatty acid desaturase [Massilia glaciei]PWF47860.1 fatty acid desaturase [Massilia glaciei]
MLTTAANRRNAGLPNLKALGHDLLLATTFQRTLWPMLPLMTLAAFAGAFTLDWYLLLPPIMIAHFLVSVTFTHDVVHGAAGVNRRHADWILFGMSLVLIESGHAFRHTHLHHHSHCLDDDDFEGAPARMTLGEALLAGPFYLPRLWLEAIRTTKHARERRWMMAELGAALALIAAAVALLQWSGAPLAYFGLIWGGSFLYPLTTAWLPHYKPTDAVLGQARTLRGKLVPALLCNLSYHLEHHLYPQVPSFNLPTLAGRLDPYFAERSYHPVAVY